MKRDLRMYILVNKDVKINKGKLAGQVGHAVNVYIYNVMKSHLEMAGRDIELKQLILNEKYKLEEYMNGEIKKIILYDSQEHLEELEKIGFIRIRDKGYTDLEPNTLTCVNLGIIDYNDIPEGLSFIKNLKLVR